MNSKTDTSTSNLMRDLMQSGIIVVMCQEAKEVPMRLTEKECNW